MMKRPLLLLVLVLMTAAVWAQQISEEQARDRALKYLTTNDAAQSRGMKVAMNRKLVRARTDAKSIYAFNLEGGGYVIASGDSRALPVLGYSDTGTFDWVNMLDNYVTPEGIIGTPEQQEAVAADNENGMFATMFIGEIDLRTGVLEYCNCGHNPPVVGGQFLEMPKSNAPIGLWPGLEFIGHTVEGMKGKMLLLYTDGVTEAENMDQKQTGDDWLIDILKEHPMDDSREMVGDILREVATHVGEAEPSDDITLLCLRIT